MKYYEISNLIEQLYLDKKPQVKYFILGVVGKSGFGKIAFLAF